LQMRAHHSSPLAGGAVAGAGEVELEQGRVSRISNVSGHYRPEFVQMAQTVEHLMRQGALLDKTVARYDATTGKGKNLEDSDDPKDAKLLKLYRSVTSLVRKQARQGQTLAAKAKAVEQRLISLGEDATEEEIERGRVEIGEINTALEALAEEVAGPMDLLRREGVGPANRASGEVEFLESVQDLGGAAVHEAKVRATKSNPQEFLSTGGGSDQADKAGDMRAELSDLKRLRDGDPDPGWDPAKLERLKALDKKVPAFPSDQDEEESEASTGLPPAPLPPPSESDIDAALERMTVAAAIESEDDESDESVDWDDMLFPAYAPEPDAEDGQVFDHEYDEDI
jgi:hypothetical protein